MPEAWRLLLAFDFGLKRIGVATANSHTRTASPLTTLAADDSPPWQELDELVRQWQPDRIVIGDPGPDANPKLREALQTFVGVLEERYSIPVNAVDESFTSSAAADELRADRRKGIYNRRLRRGQIDQQAACLIAEQWMNQAVE